MEPGVTITVDYAVNNRVSVTYRLILRKGRTPKQTTERVQVRTKFILHLYVSTKSRGGEGCRIQVPWWSEVQTKDKSYYDT